MKFILNLSLILIICFSASAIPLNVSEFDFDNNLIQTLSPTKSTTKDVPYGYDSNLSKDNIYNPTNIEFIMNGNFDKGPIILSDDHNLVLEVFMGDNLVNKYVDTKIVKKIGDTEDNETELKYLLNISQENLDLKSGQYNFKIYSTLEDYSNVAPYEVKVTYLSTAKYIPAKNNVEDGHMYLTLYFPDKNYQYLLPVSRRVPHTRKTIRTTIENLRQGAHKSLGISEASPIPKVPSIWVRNKVAYLNLPQDIGNYDDGSTIGQIALNSFINSLTSIAGVDRVKFLQAGRNVDTLFHGAVVDELLEKDNSPKIFLGLATDTNRFLLAPIDLYEENKSQNSLVEYMFNSLKTGRVNDYNHSDLFATIPSDVDLIDSKLTDDGLLTLNISKSFLNSYKNRQDIQAMMLDSLLYTFTSIPGVDSVAINIDGSKNNYLVNRNISEPMKAPSFINIEEE